MLTGALVGAVLGYAALGMMGIFLGVVCGFAVSWLVVRRTAPGAAETVNGRFISSAFAVVGAASPVYGADTDDAQTAAQTLFDKLQLDSQQRSRAQAGLRRGRLKSFRLIDELAGVARMCEEHDVQKVLFLHMQIHVLAADRNLYKCERDIMRPVARALGVGDDSLHEAEALFDIRRARREKAGDDRNQTVTNTDGLQSAYSVLGIDTNASDTEIKTAYRRQMSANHPDKIASRGLPESIYAIYERKTREVSAAYDRIRSERGLA